MNDNTPTSRPAGDAPSDAELDALAFEHGLASTSYDNNPQHYWRNFARAVLALAAPPAIPEPPSDKQRDLWRATGRESAWRDLLRRFQPGQRRHIADLLAHNWTINAIEIQSRYGEGPKRIEGAVPLALAIKDLDEERRAALAAQEQPR